MIDNLDKIKLFLKQTGYKQFRYTPPLIAKKDQESCKLEIVSDGEKTWWELNAGMRKMKHKKRKYVELDDKKYPNLYNKAMPYYLDQFFNLFAHKFIEEKKRLDGVRLMSEIDEKITK